MTSTTTAVTCPHCGGDIELLVRTEATAVPAMRLPFTNEEGFKSWLKASGLSVEEFQRLPIYEWHRDALEPLVRAAVERADRS